MPCLKWQKARVCGPSGGAAGGSALSARRRTSTRRPCEDGGCGWVRFTVVRVQPAFRQVFAGQKNEIGLVEIRGFRELFADVVSPTELRLERVEKCLKIKHLYEMASGGFFQEHGPTPFCSKIDALPALATRVARFCGVRRSDSRSTHGQVWLSVVMMQWCQNPCIDQVNRASGPRSPQRAQAR